MSDRLKFRAWFDGRFIYKSLCEANVYTEDGKCICLANMLPVLPWEQCTGLEDKNGRLIYEGDIVAKEFSNKPFSSKAKYKIKNCLVYWQESGQFSIEYNSDEYRYYSAFHDSFIGECEVIGNIHENHYLVEK